MKILIIGTGGREHALAWKIAQSPRLSQLFLTTTNASVELLKQQYGDKIAPAVKIAEQNSAELVAFAQQNKIDLVIIGSEAPLAAGLTDALMKANICVFGPTQAAAQIEASKAFAKDFMLRHNIPTARYQSFTEITAALHYIRNIDYPIVIKASGLAAGKGVFLPVSFAETETILHELLEQHTLGAASKEVIIEERLIGEEVSLLAFTDGYTIKLMPPARDHKRLLEGDLGPNTGGMGAYAPADDRCPAFLQEELAQTILQPTIDGLRAENKLFIGVLYAGLMLTANGARVLEFNCRFGDPETQVLLPLLETDLIDVIEACIGNHLAHCDITWKKASAACVVLASKDYPQASETGFVIEGLNSAQTAETAIFHAGTRFVDSRIATAGGRVLGVTAWGNSLDAAVNKAYQGVAGIHFPGMQYRRDIGNIKK